MINQSEKLNSPFSPIPYVPTGPIRSLNLSWQPAPQSASWQTLHLAESATSIRQLTESAPRKRQRLAEEFCPKLPGKISCFFLVFFLFKLFRGVAPMADHVHWSRFEVSQTYSQSEVYLFLVSFLTLPTILGFRLVLGCFIQEPDHLSDTVWLGSLANDAQKTRFEFMFLRRKL